MSPLAMPIRLIPVLLLAAALLPAAQAATQSFTESKGCKMLGSAPVIKRLQQFAAEGSVTWDGPCKNGLIDGKGVLREEGASTAGGKTKNYAYFFSGTARKGQRQGLWKRESFERFADSAVFYTTASTLKFVDGVAKGKPARIALQSLDQLTPAFRAYIIAAQPAAKPANTALLADAAPVVNPPPKTAVAPDAPNPQSVYSYFPRVTASSQHEQLGPEGLLTFQRPGWHSRTPPDYPEWLSIDLRTNREIAMIGLLAADDQQARAPKVIRIESSNDGVMWSALNAVEIPCTPNSDGGWLNLGMMSPARGRYLKIVILSNCGDAAHVALRGLRFK